MDDYSYRVSRGARFLDQVKPDWRDKIDLETFRVNDMFDCVIGQVFGSFGRLFDDDDASQAFSRHLGFQALSHSKNDDCEDSHKDGYDDCGSRLEGGFGCYDIECAFLENAWRDVLKV